MVPMPPSAGNPVRLVVQWVSGKGCYRVIVYPEPPGLRTPLTLSSRAELLQRLSAALPDFDESQLRAGNSATQIVFAETLQLSDAQLEKLFGG